MPPTNVLSEHLPAYVSIYALHILVNYTQDAMQRCSADGLRDLVNSTVELSRPPYMRLYSFPERDVPFLRKYHARGCNIDVSIIRS